MKERDLGLDIIRILAVSIILFYHFSVIYSPIAVTNYWGCIGSTLFFLISGYVTHLHHKDLENINHYYENRFLSLFPIYWITFFCLFNSCYPGS